MAQENRIQQLQHIANKDSRTEDKYDALAGGEISTSSSQSGTTTHLVPIPITLKAQLGSPVRLSQSLVLKRRFDICDRQPLRLGPFRQLSRHFPYL